MPIVDITSEDIIEKNLIRTLVASGHWTYEPDLDNEDKLWANFRKILEQNNRAVLDDVPLTDAEFDQVKGQLAFSSAFRAAEALRGEAGKFKVEVQREDASLGRIHLTVIDHRDIAGGSSVYQIINQYRVTKRFKMDGDSRFDVSLLINGLPLIHIELKTPRVSYMEAFNQIKDYQKEGKFRGIYSACQMFVVSNGTATRYIAPASYDDLNSQFLTRWVDKNNKPVDSLEDFALAALTIPEAHRLISQYTVLDYDRESLIILRPYQIHAIRAVREDLKRGTGGYVWHTTGSGKTLTSYKVAKNLLEVPEIDKTVFVVDRIDLDNQTSGAFLSYAKGDFVDIDETDNVADLIGKLKSDARTVIVTTIQKISYIIKRFEKNPDSRDLKKLKGLRLAFVVDECHRAVSSEMQRRINKFFKRPYWYGFTGTPIFAENAKITKGDLAATTEGQYGPCLHEYTVKEAILDKSVLGFQVEYKSTIGDDDAYDIIKEIRPDVDLARLDEIGREELIPKYYYESDEHMVEVIDTIVNKSRMKFGLNRGPGNTYGAILTTSSIEKAQRYYELFMDLKNNELDIKISDRVRKLMPDFPRVAITYSLAPNQDESGADKDKMKVSLDHYNKAFGTSYSLGEIRAYNVDLNDRLARKKSRFKARSEQVDIVIVVDRLLTGFDAPSLAILFMDRPPMGPASMIQAFSRTNRIYDRHKAFGQIVTFQSPYSYEEAIEDAFRLYSNGGESYIQAPTYEESLEKFEGALDEFRSVTDDLDPLSEVTELTDKMVFVRAFQKLDRHLSNISVYGDYDEEAFKEKYGLVKKELEKANGYYENFKKDIAEEIEDGSGEDDFEPIDISYESMTIAKEDIDINYLNRLMETYNKDEAKSERILEEIEEFLERLELTNPRLARLYKKTLAEMLKDPESFKLKDMEEYMHDLIFSYYYEGIIKLSKKGKVPIDTAEYFAKIHDVETGAKDKKSLNYLMGQADMDAYQKENDFKNKLQAKRAYRNEISKMVAEELAPYRSV